MNNKDFEFKTINDSNGYTIMTQGVGPYSTTVYFPSDTSIQTTIGENYPRLTTTYLSCGEQYRMPIKKLIRVPEEKNSTKNKKD